APLPRLLAYVQRLGLDRSVVRPKRGYATAALAWEGSGRANHLDLETQAEPLLVTVLEGKRLPCATALGRSLRYVSAKAIRAAVDQASRAGLAHHPAGAVWGAVDAHQTP